MKKLIRILALIIILALFIIPLALTGCAQSEQPVGEAIITTDMVNTILQTLVTAVFIPALIFLGRAAFEWLKTKTKNAILDKYFNMANDAVSTAVAEVMQTFVTTLKNNGTWTEDSAKQALLMAKAKAQQIMGVAALKALPDIVGDVEVWLTSKIEAATLEIKSYTPLMLPAWTVEDGVK